MRKPAPLKISVNAGVLRIGGGLDLDTIAAPASHADRAARSDPDRDQSPVSEHRLASVL